MENLFLSKMASVLLMLFSSVEVLFCDVEHCFFALYPKLKSPCREVKIFAEHVNQKALKVTQTNNT